MKRNWRQQLSQDDYDWMQSVGDGRCWICRRPECVDDRSLAVDHDHITDAIRGLLCTQCNRRLGGTTNPVWLIRAAAYLLIAANAFGDACRNCGKPAPKRLVKRFENSGSCVYEHECCGKRWEVGYRTEGLPYACEHFGAYPQPHAELPIDPKSSGILSDDDLRRLLECGLTAFDK